MSKVLPRIAAILFLSIILVVSEFFPDTLDEKNRFLEKFLSGSCLSVLGTMISITVASCANIYLRLSQVETKRQIKLIDTKSSIRRSAYSMIFLFFSAFMMLSIKGSLDPNGRAVAVIDGLLIIWMFLYCSILYDIMRTAFKIPNE